MSTLPVFFWRQNEIPYGVFCQWYPSRFTDQNGVVWQNMEQYIMGKKAELFKDQRSYDRIRQDSTPSRCKAVGRQVSNFDEKIWKKKAPLLAYIGNSMKFEQNIKLREILLSTGERPLYEASPLDRIWGIGLDAKLAAGSDPNEFPGTNLLGKALMKVRAKLQNA